MKMLFAQRTIGESIARAIHFLVGVCFIGVSMSQLLPSSPFNPWVFAALLPAGLGLLWVAIRADRRAVFRVLLLGWV